MFVSDDAAPPLPPVLPVVLPLLVVVLVLAAVAAAVAVALFGRSSRSARLYLIKTTNGGLRLRELKSLCVESAEF